MKSRITDQRRSLPRPEYTEETESPPTLSFSDGDDRDHHSLSSLSDNSSVDVKENHGRDYSSGIKPHNQNAYNKSSNNNNKSNISHSLSAEAYSELDQLMDIVNTGIEETSSQVMIHNSIKEKNSAVDVTRDTMPYKSASIVTRRVLKLRQRERSLPKPNLSSPKEAKLGVEIDDDKTTTQTISSLGHKSILTSATGYTEGTGTTAPRANTMTAKWTRKFRRKKDSNKISRSRSAIPECITMSCSSETDVSSDKQLETFSTLAPGVTENALVSTTATAKDNINMKSPQELALTRKASSERRLKNDLGEATKLSVVARRLVQAQSEAGYKYYKGESTALGMVQSLFECCSLQQVVEEETGSCGVLEYSDYL